MPSETDLRVAEATPDIPANDNRATGNPTIVDLPKTLAPELVEPLACTLARVLVARAYQKLGVVSAND